MSEGGQTSRTADSWNQHDCVDQYLAIPKLKDIN